MKFGLLLLTVAALVLVPLASSTPSFASKTGASCGTCHVNPNGGGKLTPAGTTFKNTGKLPVTTPPVATPPVKTPPAVTTPTQPATPTAPTIGDDENDHHDDDHHDDEHHDSDHHDGNKEHKEHHEEEEEHDED